MNGKHELTNALEIEIQRQRALEACADENRTKAYNARDTRQQYYWNEIAKLHNKNVARIASLLTELREELKP